MAISFYINILLRILNKIYNNLNNRGLISRPPKPAGFVTINLESSIIPKKVIYSHLIPNKISTFNKNKVISIPTPLDSAKLTLPEIGTYKFQYWLKGYDINNLHVLDSNYLNWYKVRKALLDFEANKVSQQLPESFNSCREALFQVVGYLEFKYPDAYISIYINNELHIVNKINGEVYSLNSQRPLDVLALLTMDDFSILQIRPDGEYYLTASATLFPIGWALNERIGYSIRDLHNSAPKWRKGDYAYDNTRGLFDKIKGPHVFHRNNYFIVNTSKLFLPENIIKIPLAGDIGNLPGFRYEDIYVRRELQTAIRLIESNSILFTVRTFIAPMTSLTDTQLLNLHELYLSIKKENREYHNVHKLEPVIRKYITEVRKLK
uniref:Uncharacterized protein n=1 Tax=Rhynchosporium graminicola TaxID=2792576 RepID=V5W5L6_9HELO|nr:hypothetical protein [Rhynchosporium commune]AHC02344.1 hypothetical protein [Rhynchosporium commune]